MTDELAILVRFGLYLVLMVLFGVPLFRLYGLRWAETSVRTGRNLRGLYMAVAFAGLLLSGLAIALLTASMSGVPLGEVEWASASMLISETGIGMAWQVRMAALLFFLFLAIATNVVRPYWSWALAFLGGIALATMAWGGHGAMSEGTVGTIHLVSDVVHLLAAGVWVAALLTLTILLFQPQSQMTPGYIALSHRALASFAVVGTIVVTLLFVSGLVNSWLLVGLAGIGSMPWSLYGQLLIAKLLLFSAMLGLAALNRYQMAPALEQAIASGDHAAAVGGLRKTLAIETSCAIVILALVAGLGTLAPPVSMNG